MESLLQSPPTLLASSCIACLLSRYRRLHGHRVASGQAEATAERRLKELGVQLDEAISEKDQIEQEARSNSKEAAEQLREVQSGGARAKVLSPRFAISSPRAGCTFFLFSFFFFVCHASFITHSALPPTFFQAKVCGIGVKSFSQQFERLLQGYELQQCLVLYLFVPEILRWVTFAVEIVTLIFPRSSQGLLRAMFP